MTIPVNFAGLIFFAVMIWPGLTYVSARERRSSSVKRSTFREAIDVVSASLSFASIFVILVVICHFIGPAWTPAPAGLLFHTQAYIRSHLGLVFVWTALGLLASRAIALALGRETLERGLHSVTKRDQPPASHGIPESQLSAWWVAFTQYPPHNANPYIGCQLTDGSFVSGWLHSYSREWEDSPDRDLTLRAPILFRPSGSAADAVLEDVGLTVVSARNILMMTVSYVPESADASG